MNAGILVLPGDFVTGEIPRICRGFSLVDRADQTVEIPCLIAYRMSSALVFTFSCSIIRENRKPACQYIKSSLAFQVKEHLSDRIPTAPVFHMPPSRRVADMLQQDLAAN